MKPVLVKIQLKPHHSFDIKHYAVNHFYNKWQYHPELELVLFLKGYGRQFIGDSVHHFKPGDMILLGSDLPHLWRSDEVFLKSDSKLKMEAIVIHFLPDCFGNTFFQLPENVELLQLLDRAQQGVRVKLATRDKVKELMLQLLVAKKSERILLLLQILSTIARSKQTKTVCSRGLQFVHNPNESDRMNNIYQFTLNHFSRKITLEQVARIACMSPHSFCRYFKSRIKKTYSHFLLEVRVGHACKLLAETQKPVSEICYECGFNTFSNFNRHFKAITGTTPLQHRSHYQYAFVHEHTETEAIVESL